MTETNKSIRVVGNYPVRWIEPEGCKRCGNAEYGDVVIDGICSKCITDELEKLKISIQDSRDLLWTSLAPDAYGMTKEQWNEYKVHKVAGQLDVILRG